MKLFLLSLGLVIVGCAGGKSDATATDDISVTLHAASIKEVEGHRLAAESHDGWSAAVGRHCLKINERQVEPLTNESLNYHQQRLSDAKKTLNEAIDLYSTVKTYADRDGLAKESYAGINWHGQGVDERISSMQSWLATLSVHVKQVEAYRADINYPEASLSP